MKHSYTAFILLVSSQVFGQKILSIEPLATLNHKACVPSILFSMKPPQTKRIEQYRVTYEAPDSSGQNRVASGLIAYRSGEYKQRTPVFYSHATVYDKFEVPSHLSKETQFAVCQLIHQGEVFIAPDYFGLGLSPGFHPYMYVKDEVLAGRSFLELVLDHLNNNSFDLSREMYFTGYSAGAHASLSILYDIIDHPMRGDFYVSQFLSMSGPFDLEGLGKIPLFVNPKKGNSALYGAYIVIGYQYVYKNIYSRIEDIVRPGYENLEEIMLSQSASKIDEFLPDFPSQIFTKEFLAEIQKDDSHPLNVALKANSLEARSVDTQFLFLYSAGDRSVLPQQSEIISAVFLDLGVTSSSRNVTSRLGHRESYTPIVYAGGRYLRGITKLNNQN